MPKKSDGSTTKAGLEDCEPKYIHFPRRKRKKVSLPKDYVGDGQYRPSGFKATTPDESEDDITAALRHKRPATRATSKIERPVDQNSKDPFDYLGDDEVGIIISFLSAFEMEKLRRVSKLWKASSEFHNAGEALQRHFGHIGERAADYPTTEAASLAFRRRVYHEVSLKRGRATTALSCFDVLCWHICNRRLLLADCKGQICIRDLQYGRSDEETATFGVSTLLGPRAVLNYARINEMGEVIASIGLATATACPEEEATGMGIDGIRAQGSISTRAKHYLLKLSPNGSLVWKVQQHGCNNGRYWGLCYVGTTWRDRHYGFEPVEDADGTGYAVVVFTVRDLRDGQIVMQKKLPSVMKKEFNTQSIEKYSRRPRLSISTDGSFATLEVAGVATVYLVDCLSGETTSFSRRTPSTVLLGAANQPIWAIDYAYRDQPPSQRLIYNATAKTLDATDVYLIHQFRYGASGVGVDMYRSLMFRLIHSDVAPDRSDESMDPFTTVAIVDLVEDLQHEMTLPRRRVHAFVEQKKMNIVTLPARRQPVLPASNSKMTKTTGKTKASSSERRLLEAEAAWTIRGGDFVGMAGDYLVYYAALDQTLMVLDFWPRW